MTRLAFLFAALSLTLPVGGSQGLSPYPSSYLPPEPPPDYSAIPEAYRQMIIDAATEAGVPVLILAGIAYAESGFNPAPAHQDPLDRGMFGIREAPGYHEERAALFGEYDPEVPAEAARVAAGILAGHRARFGSWDLAVAAYHQGAGGVVVHGAKLEYVWKVRGL